jgi:hypothetical protein
MKKVLFLVLLSFSSFSFAAKVQSDVAPGSNATGATCSVDAGAQQNATVAVVGSGQQFTFDLAGVSTGVTHTVVCKWVNSTYGVSSANSNTLTVLIPTLNTPVIIIVP